MHHRSRVVRVRLNDLNHENSVVYLAKLSLDRGIDMPVQGNFGPSALLFNNKSFGLGAHAIRKSIIFF